ncbi:hypothetical protein FSHL1_000775 [Fusarium sambucinum]
MADTREVKEAHAGTNKATLESFLDKTRNEQTDPGQAKMLWATTCPQTLADLSTIDLPAVSRDKTLTLVKNVNETPSSRESNPQNSSMQGSTTSHKRFAIQSTVSKQDVFESLETQCRQANSHLMESREGRFNWEQPKMASSEPSPIVQLLQRRQASRVGRKADPLPQKEAERSATQDRLTALPSPTREATAWSGLRNLPKTAKEIEASKDIVKKNLTQLNMLYQTILEIRDHDIQPICAQNTNHDTTNMYEVKEACASINTIITTGESATQAQTKPGSPQRATLRNNAKQFGSIPNESWAEYIAETRVSVRDSSDQFCVGEPSSIFDARAAGTNVQQYNDKGIEMEETGQTILVKDSAQLGNGCLLPGIDRTESSEQAMKLGAQMSGSLQEHQDAEGDTADLSSNKHCQSQEGGLWQAIKEFVQTVSEYSTWLLRLYLSAIKPVFDTRSSYWRCADREDHGWVNLVSLCLALPLIFGLSMVLVWGMELTVIALKCMDEDQDCMDYMADEALAMFQRSLTGVYPYE